MDQTEFLAAVDSLAQQRPVFHSEADLQHALVWELATRHPGMAVRLERPFRVGAAVLHVDAVLRSATETIAIELKHWTRLLHTTVHEEEFQLAEHSAEDHARHGFWSDVVRLEQLVNAGIADRGFVLALTNQPRFWDPGRFTGTAHDSDFRLHEGHVTTGHLEWAASASSGSTKPPLDVAGTYEARWRDYSQVDRHVFRFLVASV